MSINFVVEQADSASTKPTKNTPGAITSTLRGWHERLGRNPARNRHSSILDWLKTPIPSWGIYEATRRKAARRRHRRGRALITTSVERCPLRSGESPVGLLLQSQNRTTELRTRPGSVLIGRHSFGSTSCPTGPTTRSQQEKVEDCHCYSAQCPRTQN